ncbi:MULTISPECIES: branched-chain amino acid ABC transporter permease [unclassified Rhodococcus (in: high G+C Gram-positive bacteria)]|uniref:branched-chain amino acid ABC transporter permease n=1 Tax=unclassified Rhodococcus (in: high G+C Gram-positive bacteria) TaxID=192944 RepID=UPI0009E6BBE6|nr:MULTISPECIES: branched-chain amino acid ABC transporter permease [unclassified Rhodococcus (in: high G+C Gram-positive bacteria)]
MTVVAESAATEKTRRAVNPGVAVGGALVVILAVIFFVGGKDQGLVGQAIVSGLLLGGVYALISVGLTLIFGVLGIVNFAQGAMLTLAMYIVYALSTAGLPVYVATLLAVPVMFVFGMIVQATLLTKLTIGGSHEGPLLVTLGLSLLIINVLLMVFGGRPKSVEAPVDGSISILGTVADWPRVLAFVGAAVVAIALKSVLERTRLGLSIRAVASNSEGAKLVGVDIGRVYALTFGIGAACVAVAGGLMTPFTSLTPSVGEQFTILAFVIVVLGGLGSVVGAMVGGIVIGLVQTVGALYLPGTGSLILVFAVFVMVLFLKPEGLYGGRR